MENYKTYVEIENTLYALYWEAKALALSRDDEGIEDIGVALETYDRGEYAAWMAFSEGEPLPLGRVFRAWDGGRVFLTPKDRKKFLSL